MKIKDDGLPVGTILLDRYRIEREIGAGGMSHVYLAGDQWRNESYAVIKTPFAKLLDDKWVVKKFKQEAESLARLDHQGIVKLLGHGEYEKQYPFVILEFIEGATLKQLINEMTSDPKRAVKIFLQIAQAVEHAHSHDIFHRDLKPENIMLKQIGTEDESVKIIDFGIARIDNSFFVTGTKTRYQIGTPHYISPNRLRHDPDDRADDIYALGLIAYEMLTGTNPLREARDFTELKRVQEQILPPRQVNSKLPKAVDREIVKALSLNQSNRHSCALELGTRLHDAFFSAKQDTTKTLIYQPAKAKNQYATVKVLTAEDYLANESFDETKLLTAVSPGEQFLLQGDFESAIAFYNEKIKTNERADLFYSRRAMAFLMKKDYENATLDCQKALKIYSKNDFAHLIRGIIYRLRLWSAEAETELLKAININQNNLEAALILGDVYASRNEIEKALNYYSHICRVNPRFTWAYSNRGNLYYNKGDYTAAIEDFTLAIKTNPDLAWNYYQRAKARAKSEKNAEAVEDLTEAIKLDPKNTTFYNERAKLYFNLGKTSEALTDFNRVKEFSARVSFIADEQGSMEKDKKSGLASLIDYLKWILIGQPKSY
ncbi:hypothetical protein BH10ACI1_BH10ACI1_04180 [soil metagenome]